MFYIIDNVLENDFFYDGNLILTYKINYPQIANYNCISNKFNSYNKQIAFDLQDYIENTLLQDAKNLYEYNKSNGYPIMVYEIIYTYNVTYNANNIISIYSDQYIYSGGAHGLTTRSSQNWNMQCGKLISLNDLYKNNPYFILDILKNINTQIEHEIENGTNQYFEDYCKLVLNTFNPQQFYIISDNEIAIYFQQYDIAPYSSGIPVFKLPY